MSQTNTHPSLTFGSRCALYLLVVVAPRTILHWRSAVRFSMGSLYRDRQLPFREGSGQEEGMGVGEERLFSSEGTWRKYLLAMVGLIEEVLVAAPQVVAQLQVLPHPLLRTAVSGGWRERGCSGKSRWWGVPKQATWYWHLIVWIQWDHTPVTAVQSPEASPSLGMGQWGRLWLENGHHGETTANDERKAKTQLQSLKKHNN